MFKVVIKTITAGPGFGPFMADKTYIVDEPTAKRLFESDALKGEPIPAVAADETITDVQTLQAQVAALTKLVMQQTPPTPPKKV